MRPAFALFIGKTLCYGERGTLVTREEPRWEPLGGGVSVLVSRQHRFGTDTLLLSCFAQPRPSERRAAELCAGCGALSLRWFQSGGRSICVDAVELQREACGLMRRSVGQNGLQEYYRPVEADLRLLKGTLPGNAYDLVVCNPPYMPLGTGLVNGEAGRRIARHESECTLSDVTGAAACLLRFSGRLCLCQRPERLCAVLKACQQAGLEPKRLRFVQQRPGKAPKLFLLEAKKGARPGGLVTEPILIIEDAKGGYSQEMLEIYGDYARKEGSV